MTRAETYLVDAGVWIAAGDPRDRFSDSSRAIVLDFERSLAALDLTLYEVANVALREGKPAAVQHLTRTVLRRCEGGVVAVDEDLMLAAADLGSEHGLTAYDAAYVATARRHGWTLISTDIADLVSKGLAVTPDDADYP